MNTCRYLVTVLGYMTVVFWAAGLSAQIIPAPGQLSGTPGPGPGQITLTWKTPFFENPTPQYPFDCAYVFRTGDELIDESTWDNSDSGFGVLPPTLAWCAGIVLDLNVNGAEEDGYLIADKAHMRAYLLIQFDCFNFYLPGGVPLQSETILFEAFDPTDNRVVLQSAVTNHQGIAEFTTHDLYDDQSGSNPCMAEAHTFKASWEGHELGNGAGVVVVSTGRREDTEEMIMCDSAVEIEDPDQWSPFGGIYHQSFAGVNYEFTVPAAAVEVSTIVLLATPPSVPPPSGMMPPSVPPTPMIAFELMAIPDIDPCKPYLIAAEYPDTLLSQYGGLGESSLRPYRFDPCTADWQMLDDGPIGLVRDYHTIIFQADTFGMFALAAELDTDHDDLGDSEELHYGTDPELSDTDGDGIDDGTEIWVARSDPVDPLKKDDADQHCMLQGLTPGQSYYVAGRIKGVATQSDVSNCIQVQAGPDPTDADVNDDGSTDIVDFAILAGEWLQ